MYNKYLFTTRKMNHILLWTSCSDIVLKIIKTYNHIITDYKYLKLLNLKLDTFT